LLSPTASQEWRIVNAAVKAARRAIESERYSPRREHAHSPQPQICEPTADYFKYQKRDTTGTEEEDDGGKHNVAGTAIL